MLIGNNEGTYFVATIVLSSTLTKAVLHLEHLLSLVHFHASSLVPKLSFSPGLFKPGSSAGPCATSDCRLP